MYTASSTFECYFNTSNRTATCTCPYTVLYVCHMSDTVDQAQSCWKSGSQAPSTCGRLPVHRTIRVNRLSSRYLKQTQSKSTLPNIQVSLGITPDTVSPRPEPLRNRISGLRVYHDLNQACNALSCGQKRGIITVYM